MILNDFLPLKPHWIFSLDKIGPLNIRTAIIFIHAFVPNDTISDDDDIIYLGMIDDFAWGFDPKEYHLERTFEDV